MATAGQGRLFVDQEFGDKSICYKCEDSSWHCIEWKRPGELFVDPKFIDDGASRTDLSQGELGNCWFVSAVATLTMNPVLFYQVVPKHQGYGPDYSGKFQFRFWRYGEWNTVVIDDRLPTKNGKLVFCHSESHPNVFWGALLEKAYAKIHGSYQALGGGMTQDALVDFTGGIGEAINLVDVPNRRLYGIIERSLRGSGSLGPSLATPSGDSVAGGVPENGLVTNHAYSVTKASTIKYNGKMVLIVRLRNPWGKKEWNGAWSDRDTAWSKVSRSDKEKLGFKNADDGEFWMSIEDLRKNFSTLFICHLKPDSVQGGTGKKQWHGTSRHDSWDIGTSAGGSWREDDRYWTNRQYRMAVENSDIPEGSNTCDIVVSLMQKYQRRRKTAEKSEKSLNERIGFDLFRVDYPTKEERKYSAKEMHLYRRCEPKACRERVRRIPVSVGSYCIVPFTLDPGTEGQYLIRFAMEGEKADLCVTKYSLQYAGSRGATAATKIMTRDFRALFAEYTKRLFALDLRKLLNKGLHLEGNMKLSEDTCRILAGTRAQGKKSEKLDETQCRRVWEEVIWLKEVFMEYDLSDSGTLKAAELFESLPVIGISQSREDIATASRTLFGLKRGNPFTLDEYVRLTHILISDA